MPDPLPTAVTTPDAEARKTPGSLVAHAAVPEKAAPNWSVIVALNAAVSPSDASVAD